MYFFTLKFIIMNHTKTIAGFVAGLSIGVIATILLSPDKGSVTRQRIIDRSNSLGNSVKDYFAGLIKGKKTNGTSIDQPTTPSMTLNTMG